MTCTSCGNSLESFNRFCPKCGAPAPTEPAAPSYGSYRPQPYSAPQSPMMSGPMGPMSQPVKKSGCGKIILIVAIILLVLAGGIAAAIYFGYQKLETKLKSSEAYTIALNRLRENEEVKNELGDIKDTGFPLGAYDEKADGSGGAAFVMSVQGTKANGRYDVALKREDSVWTLFKGTLRTDGGKIIDLVGNYDHVGDANTNLNHNSSLELPTPRDLKAGKIISGGVLNGKATNLPTPPYPPAARAVNASGTVVVQVVVDEEGNVVTANAVSGHPLLRPAAVSAARLAKFTPTKLSGKAVKVSGVITYNFVR